MNNDTQQGKNVQNVDNADAKEYTDTYVPKSERRGFLTLLFVWIGYVFTVTIMTAGGSLAEGARDVTQAMQALGIAVAFLVSLGVLMGIMSGKTGLTFGLLAKFSFGEMGQKIISLLVTITLLGWFSINAYIVGNVTNVLFSSIPVMPMTIIAGALMTYTALKGLDIMNKIGTVATILILLIGGYSLFTALSDVGGIEGLVQITNTDTLPFNNLVSIAIGALVSGAITWAPDIMRFADSKKTAVGVMVTSVGFAAPMMLIIGMVGMLVYNEADIAYILKAQGLVIPAWFALVSNVWSTAQGNVYSSSLNLASIFTKISRRKLVIIFGAVGTLMGLLGIYRYFGQWLSFLASIFPAIGGVLIADYFVTYRRGKGYFSIDEVKLPNYIWLSFVSMTVGIATYYLLPIGLTAINSLIAAFIVQSILSVTIIRKQINDMNTHIDHIEPMI